MARTRNNPMDNEQPLGPLADPVLQPDDGDLEAEEEAGLDGGPPAGGGVAVAVDAKKTTFVGFLTEYGLSEVTAGALYDIGYSDFASMAMFTASDVEETCRALRREKFLLSMTSQKILTVLCYGLALEQRCFRFWEPPLAVHYNAWETHQQIVKDYRDPTSEFDLDGFKNDWPKIMENLEMHLRSFRSQRTHAPLTYVIRPNQASPPQVGGLVEHLAQVYRGNYDDMLVARCLHWTDNDSNKGFTMEYLLDNEKVQQILLKIFRHHPAYTYVHSFSKSKDGRGAWNSLKLHYLGTDNVNNLAAQYEAERAKLVYHGERRRWTFDQYANKHVELFNAMNALKSEGYCGIDHKTAIRQMTKGIKAKELAIACNTVILPASQIHTLDQAIAHIKESMIQTNAAASLNDSETRQISSVNNNGKRNRGDDNSQVENRFYTPSEFAKLTKEQKAALRSKRKKRNHKSSKNASKSTKFDAKSIKTLSDSVTKAVVSVLKTESVTDDSSTTEEPPKQSKKGSNRNHSALTRQRQDS